MTQKDVSKFGIQMTPNSMQDCCIIQLKAPQGGALPPPIVPGHLLQEYGERRVIGKFRASSGQLQEFLGFLESRKKTSNGGLRKQGKKRSFQKSLFSAKFQIFYRPGVDFP